MLNSHRTVYTAGGAGEGLKGKLKENNTQETAKKGLVPAIVSVEWYNKPDNYFMGAFDTLMHVAAWILIIILDHILFDKADGWSKIVPPATVAVDAHTSPYAMAALICSWIAFGTILTVTTLHLIVYMSTKGIEFVPPSMMIATITSATRASMVFTLVITLFTVGVTVDRGEEWRNFTIIAIIVKLYLSAKLNKNEEMKNEI